MPANPKVAAILAKMRAEMNPPTTKQMNAEEFAAYLVAQGEALAKETGDARAARVAALKDAMERGAAAFEVETPAETVEIVPFADVEKGAPLCHGKPMESKGAGEYECKECGRTSSPKKAKKEGEQPTAPVQPAAPVAPVAPAVTPPAAPAPAPAPAAPVADDGVAKSADPFSGCVDLAETWRNERAAGRK